jgi:FeS assembly SUF system protein
MASKNLWQSVTGWISKPADPPVPEDPADRSLPRQTESAAAPRAPSPPGLPLVGQPAGSHAAVTSGPAVAADAEATPAAAEAAPEKDDPELKNKIIEVIKTCYDPEIPVNIYELGLIYDVKIDAENNAHIKMTLTAPSCPAAQSLPADVKRKVETLEEIRTANVEIVFDPPWTPNQMSDSAKLVLNIL